AADSNAERLSIRVGDDGGGIGDELAQELGQRGKRADESVPGQGIGLAVVRETVELYRGALSVGRSELGGAEVRIELARAGSPGASAPTTASRAGARRATRCATPTSCRSAPRARKSSPRSRSTA